MLVKPEARHFLGTQSTVSWAGGCRSTFATSRPGKDNLPARVCKLAMDEQNTSYAFPVQGTNMTQPSGDEKNLACPVYQTNGSSGTSKICWSTGSPDESELLSQESGDLTMSAFVRSTSRDPCSLRSTDGALLESRRRLHNNGDFSLSDTPQNCHLHIG